MSRRPVGVHRPALQPGTGLAWALLVLMLLLLAWMLAGALRTVTPTLQQVQGRDAATTSLDLHASGYAAQARPAPLQEPLQPMPAQPAPQPAPSGAGQQVPAGRAAQGPTAPYRFTGRVSSPAGPAVVLFGRGRVVMLQGPGPLDEEYVVETLGDDYLLLRHLPTGSGQFLPLTLQQARAVTPADPETLPRD